jgi:hypothetical protein
VKVARLAGLISLAAVLSSCMLGISDPGRTVFVTNETGQTYFLRFFDSATALVYEIPGGRSGLVDVTRDSNKTFDVLLQDCSVVASRALVGYGDWQIALRGEPASLTIQAEPTVGPRDPPAAFVVGKECATRSPQ